MNEIHIDPDILAVRELHCVLLASGYLGSSIRNRLFLQARAILEGHKVGNSAVAFHLGSWCPGFIGMDAPRIMSSRLSMDQALDTIAKEHGYKDWSAVAALQELMLDEEFEETVDAVVEGQISRLQARLRTRPELIKQESQYGHGATLLHYVCANGVESYRQITPLNAAEVTRCLIQAGADVNAVAGMYGGSTALELVLTSAHPHNAGITQSIADVLRHAGAR